MKSLIVKSILFVLIFFTGFNIHAQDEKKVLTLNDYDKWSRIVSANLSDDGSWISYAYRPNDGDDSLYYKNIDTETVYLEPYCSNPVFSNNSKWLVFYRNIKKKEAEKIRKNKKKVFKKGVLLNLTTQEKIEWDKVSNLSFSPSSNHVIIKKDNKGANNSGSDILIKKLDEDWIFNIGNVSLYKFNKQGTRLAYIIDADNKAGNGVYIMNLENNIIIPLDTDTVKYSKLIWDDESLYRSEWGTKGTSLAVLKGNKPDSLGQAINTLMIFTGLGSNKVKKLEFVPEKNSGFPAGYVLSELGQLEFSLDNKRLVVSIKEQETIKKMSRDSIANVDVWHWNDEEIQSVQMRRSSRNKSKTYKGIIHLEDMRFVQLSSDNMRNINFNRMADFAIGSDPKPYIGDTNWGGAYNDYYLINTKTGDKTLIERKIGRSMGISPQGNYFLYFKNANFFVYDLYNKQLKNITGNMDVSFFNKEEDHPYENPSYGLAGWSKDGKTILLNHKYDLWSVFLDGSGGYNLTDNYGSENEIRFRINRTGSDPSIDIKERVYLSAYGEWTKKSGYFLLKDGKIPQELLFSDASYGRLSKAYSNDKFLFTRQTFVDFPDYFTTNAKFKNPDRQTNANPQQSEYKWGKRVLIDFENKHGDHLAGTLTLPAGYEKGKKYPMIVYFYEKVSQRHHSYSMPTYDDRPHMSTYASDGYLVLLPDIKYYEGQPGWNALDCVTSATKKVIDLGYADPTRIGMQGHSWGGYQSSFIITQTDMFACTVTGAPVTNLTSMYNILYKNSGTNNHGIFERGQVRMGKGMFDDMKNYIDQSPVQNAAGINNPFMILHGTIDGAVDWNQGLEFYNAARRLGKEVILLSYPNENHHLANLNNKKDFQKRMKQYFDHYLKGASATEWMKTGVPFLKKAYENAKK